MRMNLPYYWRMVLISSLTYALVASYAIPHLITPLCRYAGLLLSPVIEVLIAWIILIPLAAVFTRLVLQMKPE
jgi:hypothetical protein